MSRPEPSATSGPEPAATATSVPEPAAASRPETAMDVTTGAIDSPECDNHGRGEEASRREEARHGEDARHAEEARHGKDARHGEDAGHGEKARQGEVGPGTPPRPVPVLISAADTDLLAAGASGGGWRLANPARTSAADLPGLLDGAFCVVVRLLGGARSWPEGLAAVRTSGLPTVVLSGEPEPDAELMAASTVPAGVATQALAYLREGGPANLASLARFLSDTILLTGEGFEPPVPLPAYGQYGNRPARPDRPTVGIVFYRAHVAGGNTGFVDALADAVEAHGGNARPVFCGSLRSAGPEVYGLLAGIDALIVTVLAAGGAQAATAGAGGDDDAWDVAALASLDVPVLQALCLTTTRRAWQESAAGLTPVDAAMQVAVPEFDGRLITVPFSFKEPGPDGVPVYVADPERAARVAGLAVAHARLRRIRPGDRRVAIMLSSYPTRHARVGNAVGLDTPASAMVLLHALRQAGYDLGGSAADGARPGGAGPADGSQAAARPADGGPDTGLPADGGPDTGLPADGDDLIHRLIAAGGHDTEWLTEEQLAAAPIRVPGETYARWFAELPATLREAVTGHWGEPPGSLYTHRGDIVLAGLRFRNVVVMIQPPRGFGENPVAIYHDPDLPPSHHYLAAYRWLEREFGAHAIVHLGKHGTCEWLPGKGLGLSAGCAPDAVLGNTPLVYPFIVNDPGEGTQAKRRAHATIVDHLIPPLARADSYGDLARLEQLLDEYATVSALDPVKLPAVRAQIWELVRSAQLHHDLGLDSKPGAAEFDDFVRHVDGYLCEIKDAVIRDGLHVLGAAPAGEQRIATVAAVLRATQMWGGRRVTSGLRAALAQHFLLNEASLLSAPGQPVSVPAALTALAGGAEPADGAGAGSAAGPGTTLGAGAARPESAATAGAGSTGGPQDVGQVARSGAEALDALEAVATRLVTAMDAAGWEPGKAPAVVAGLLGAPDPEVAAVLEFAAAELVPRLARTGDEVGNLLRALEGRYVPAGPSGSPTRGLVNVLPTGRNFYSVDPKAIPSANAWHTGAALAESLLARHLAETGSYPRSVGLTVWGTSAMRTQGDDIAEVLALIGCRPTWDGASRRVTGFEIVPLAELGRPRVDVTVRISGFFRDAFGHVITLLDDAITAVAGLDEPAESNYLRAHADEDTRRHGDRRRATTRIFGSKPGAYGAGLLPLIDARNWRDDADLAEVYAVWGGYAYGRGLDGAEARADLEANFARIAVAAKNTDTREHDIADSDDYFQFHGGMIAMVRHLAGRSPAAYIGDSARPEQVRTRTLAEETRRVFRSRVVNPRWIAAMTRHGYKGAFELAATVDYLFGYDATAKVVEDWMYEQLAASYVFDERVRQFMRQSNPWALRGIAERLLEAAERGLWQHPGQDTLDRLRDTYLELEGDLEGEGP
jgi:cobaltochelatase CobN